MNKDNDKCSKCGSDKVHRDWGKVGMFVSYYTLVCEVCGYKEGKREGF